MKLINNTTLVELYLDWHDWTVGFSHFCYKVHGLSQGWDITLHFFALKVLIRF